MLTPRTMKNILPLLVLAAVVCSSCGNTKKHSLVEPTQAYTPGQNKTEESRLPASDTAGTSLQAGQPSGDWDKKIVKHAQLSLEVNNYQQYSTRLHSLLKQYGAYIAQEEQHQLSYRLENEVAIRVPAVQFEQLLQGLSADSTTLWEKKITTEDVTGEIVDIKARMEARKQVREQYLSLLKQAKSMKDILDIQNEINGIQEEIEAAAGRMAYLQHDVAYSTIRLTYYQQLASTRDEPGLLQQLRDAFAAGTTGMVTLLLLLVQVWPLWLAGATGIWLWRRRKRTWPYVQGK